MNPVPTEVLWQVDFYRHYYWQRQREDMTGHTRCKFAQGRVELRNFYLHKKMRWENPNNWILNQGLLHILYKIQLHVVSLQ